LVVSERRVCRVLGQHRSTQSKIPRGANDEEALTDDIVALARQYGRYGYRRVTALLRDAGWAVNRNRVERIWRREGLKVPQKQPKRGRLWLNDGSCIRLRPEYPGHVWAYDFVKARTQLDHQLVAGIVLALGRDQGCASKPRWVANGVT